MLIISMFAFRELAVMLTLTGGGPGQSTELLSFYIYKKAFVQANYGEASSASLFMIIFSAMVTSVYFYFSNRHKPELTQ
jgi:multiple sugar transport system permease protein